MHHHPPLNADLAAQEIRRCTGKSSIAVAFSENPVPLGLPSIYGNYWDPFLAACEETETVINMHIGSSSAMAKTAPDAPLEAGMALTSENSVHAFVDWLSSGVLARFPGIKIALSEGQVGWMPFMLERLDSVWSRSSFYGGKLRGRAARASEQLHQGPRLRLHLRRPARSRPAAGPSE